MRFRIPRAARVGALLVTAFAIAVPIAVAGSVSEVTPLSPAAPVDASQPAAEVLPNGWFVELKGTPVADGGSLSALQAEKAAFRAAAKKASVAYTERYAFDTLWNGFALEMGSTQLAKVSAIDGVTAIYPIERITLPETSPVSDPELETAIKMTGADIAQSELGFTGEGVRVAIMDTGTDYDHPDLGGDGVARSNSSVFPTSRVVTGWDFVGDAFNADPSSLFYNPTPAPDQYPDDCNSHGTHVSGIVGANGAVTGVAPDVTFGAYRVFGCQGSTTADIMIAAMERALADDMDILNMSIGSAFNTWTQYPTAAASNRLVNAGMVVVASIGNSGANGTYSAGAPGVGQKVIGVASFDNTHVNLNSFTISPDGTRIGYGNAASAPPAPLSGSLPMALTSPGPPAPLPTADACAPLPAGSLAGMAALIRRGTCTFHTKSLNAQNAGAAAVVLYNNVAGRFSPTVAGVPPITIPVVAISDTEGVLIRNRLGTGPVTMTWTEEAFTAPNPTGGLISSFSSFGLSAVLDVKPDIGAPGGLIRSTYPIELGSYATISGTSMSSPHVAGAAALFLEAHPNTNPQVMRSLLQNSADPAPWWGNPALGFLDNVHRQGAGMLDIDDAILATTKITPGKLALGESQAGPQTRTLTLENSSSSAVTYDLSYVNALSTSGTNTDTGIPPAQRVNYWTSDATVSFSSASVTVPAGGSATVDATINAPSGPNQGQYGGYIVLTPQGGGQMYRVPFAGFAGDYQSLTIFGGGFGAPLLGRLNSCTPAALLRGLDCFGTGSYSALPAGATFNLTSAIAQTPYLLVHLDHQARRLRAEVFAAGSGKAWHRAFDLEYLARNSTSTSFFAFPWDGTTFAGNKTYTVPNGQYVVKVTAFKALGSDTDVETWTSPVITIARP